jgi:hypothetical protein
MQFGPYDVKYIQLKSYLRDFFVRPDMSESVWGVANFCMGHPFRGYFSFKFHTDLAMRQFALSCLLTCKRQLSWEAVKSYFVVQSNLGNERLLTDYGDLDVVFILHEPGTMQNSRMGEMLGQVAVLRGVKKTFLLDTGGPSLSYPGFKSILISDAYASLVASHVAGNKPLVSSGEFDI